MAEFFGILLVLAIFGGGSCVGHRDGIEQGKKEFIKLYQEAPYCMESSASVLDKTVTIKRCFIAKELKLLEK